MENRAVLRVGVCRLQSADKSARVYYLVVVVDNGYISVIARVRLAVYDFDADTPAQYRADVRALARGRGMNLDLVSFKV